MTKKGYLTAAEYRTIRQTLGFSQAEAAAFHRVRSVITIKRWESGKSFVSELACNKITALFEQINQVVKEGVEKIFSAAKDTQIVLIVYPEGCRDLIPGLGDLPLSVHTAMVRRTYIAARELGRKVGLVNFNPQSYFSFLAANNLKDGHDSRSAWACFEYDHEKEARD